MGDSIGKRKTKKIENLTTMNRNNNRRLKITDWLAIIAIVVTLLIGTFTIIMTVSINNKTNSLTEKLSSKDYELTQDMKSDLIVMVGLLKTIEDGAFLANYTGGVADFSAEQESLKALRNKASYHAFLSIIEDRTERIMVENGMLLLTENFLVSDDTHRIIIRAWAHEIKSAAVKYYEYDCLIDSHKVLEEMASANSFFTKSDLENLYKESISVVKHFLWKLKIDGVDDQEIKYLDSVFNAPANQNREFDSAFWNDLKWKARSNIGLWEEFLEYVIQDSKAPINANNPHNPLYPVEDTQDSGPSSHNRCSYYYNHFLANISSIIAVLVTIVFLIIHIINRRKSKALKSENMYLKRSIEQIRKTLSIERDRLEAMDRKMRESNNHSDNAKGREVDDLDIAAFH